VTDVAWPLTSPPADAEPCAAESTTRDDATRFRRLVDAHLSFIWRSLRGLGVPAASVDDAVQHVFLIASQKLTEIRPGSERAFLFGTALGVAANARRARARQREVLDDDVVRGTVDTAANGEELLEMRERRELLDDVLASMPDDLRVVFVLFVLEGMTARELSELLDLPAGTVASRLRRAREAFHAAAARVQARGATSRRRTR
jgi:RNA polymerase sigma-70 factor (ECF subfamily)